MLCISFSKQLPPNFKIMSAYSNNGKTLIERTIQKYTLLLYLYYFISLTLIAYHRKNITCPTFSQTLIFHIHTDTLSHKNTQYTISFCQIPLLTYTQENNRRNIFTHTHRLLSRLRSVFIRTSFKSVRKFVNKKNYWKKKKFCM